MHSQAIKSNADHNREAELALASRLYDLCLAAGLEAKQLKEAKAAETKSETPCLTLAENAIRTLDTRIAAMSQDNLYKLDKTAILNASLYHEVPAITQAITTLLHEKDTSQQYKLIRDFDETLYKYRDQFGKELLNITYLVVTYRLHSVLTLLLQHGIKASEAEALNTAAKELNDFAFQTLIVRNKPDKADTLTNLLLLTLQRKPIDTEEARDQEAIASYLIEENNRIPFITNQSDAIKLELVKLAAVNAVSLTLVDKLIPFTKLTQNKINFDGFNLESLFTEQTPQNKDQIEKILYSLLTHYYFYAYFLTHGLLEAIQKNYVEKAPADTQEAPAITLLKVHGAAVTQAELDEALKQVISRKEYTDCSTRIKALHKAGSKINPTPQLGNTNLEGAIKSNDHLRLETILTLSWFSTEQLNQALTFALKSSGISTEIFKTLFAHGTSFYGTLRANGSLETTFGYLFHKITADSYIDNTAHNDTKKEKAITEKNNAITILLLGIPTLTKPELKEMLLTFATLKVQYDNGEYYDLLALDDILRAMLAAGADIHTRSASGQTILASMIFHKNYPGALRILELQHAEGNIVEDNGKYYYLFENHHFYFAQSRSYFNSLIVSSTSDLFLLARGNPSIITALMKYRFPITKDTLATYERISKINNQYHNDFITTALPTLVDYSKRQKHTFKAAPELKENAELGTELKSVTKPSTREFNPVLTLALTHEDFIATRNPSVLAEVLNRVIEADIAEAAEAKDHDFSSTIHFIITLKEARFDYIKILADETHLPLRAILTAASKIPKENVAPYYTALMILLSNAPFSQFLKLKSDNAAYEKLLKSLPEDSSIKELMDCEAGVPRADLPDLLFYLQQRAKNPDDQFDKRAETLAEFLRLVRTDGMITMHLKTAMKGTTIIGLSSQTTRLMKSMRHELHFVGLRRNIEPAYFKSLRFFATPNYKDPMIQHAEADIQTVYMNRRQQNK